MGTGKMERRVPRQRRDGEAQWDNGAERAESVREEWRKRMAGGAGKAGVGKAREKEEREAITYAFVHFFAGRYLFVKKLRLY